MPKRIVKFRALKLGDMLCTVPAFRALRSALPVAHISLFGLPWAEGFVKRFNEYIGEFIAFPGCPGLNEQPPNVHSFPSFLSQKQSFNFDLAIQMRGSGQVSNPFTVLLGTRRNAGFYLPPNYCPNPILFMPYPMQEPEIWRHLHLLGFLGIPPIGEYLEFPLYKDDWEEYEHIQSMLNLSGEYVSIHPGATNPARCWPAERFALVADGLAALGLQIVLTGSRDEAHLTETVAAQMEAPAVDLAGRTSPGCLAVLLSQARLTINNDTGISHLSVAVKAPSIILFSAPDSRHLGPRDRERHIVIEGARKATPEDVLGHATQQLRKAYEHAS